MHTTLIQCEAAVGIEGPAVGAGDFLQIAIGTRKAATVATLKNVLCGLFNFSTRLLGELEDCGNLLFTAHIMGDSEGEELPDL